MTTVNEQLRPGESAYADAAWVCDDGRESSSAIFFHEQHGLRWPGDDDYVATRATSGEAATVAALHAMADAVQQVARGSTRVACNASGLLAEAIAQRLDVGGSTDPDLVVDVTGRADAVAAAMAAVSDLGTVVLAVTPTDGVLPLDLYVDAHKRGLRIVGAVPPRDVDSFLDAAALATRPLRISDRG